MNFNHFKLKKPFFKIFPLLVWWLILEPLTSHANTIRFEKISEEHGLSQASVQCIHQDSRGFLWIGTSDGLNRYDGYEFITYKKDTQKENALNNNRIRALYDDDQSRLWIGTEGGGLNLFDRISNQFFHYSHDPKNPDSISGDNIYSIYEDSEKQLWIGTDKGLDRFDRSAGIFYHYNHDPEDDNTLSNDFILSIFEDSRNFLWVGTAFGLNRINKRDGKILRYNYNSDQPRRISDYRVYFIFEDHRGILWIGTEEGLNSLDRDSGKIRVFKHDPENPLSLGSNIITSIYEDNDNKLWIGTYGGGLSLYHYENDYFTCYRENPSDSESLSDDGIKCIYEDDGGILWIGTGMGGLNKYDKTKNRIRTFLTNPGSSQNPGNSRVMAVYKDSLNRIWIGTTKGITILNGEAETATPKEKPKLIHEDKRIHSILEDSHHEIWIGTFSGLIHFRGQDKSSRYYKNTPGDSHSLSHNNIYTIIEDSSGDLWIGTNGGLNHFSRKSGKFTAYHHNPESPHSLKSDTVYALMEDSDGLLWIGTYKGLSILDRKSGEIIDLSDELKISSFVKEESVFCLYEDVAGFVWIGTWGGGLKGVNRRENRFVSYTEKEGLANNVVYGILEDDKGRLWISTNKGISRFDQKTGEFRNYNSNDGFSCNEFNLGACFKDKNGFLYFGGVKGLNIFHPDDLKADLYKPPVAITELLVANKLVNTSNQNLLKRSVSELNELTLSFRQNIISFEFSALYFSAPLKNQYAYKLEGYDREWIYSGNRRYASYTNLDPGSYTFKVKGANKDGQWNEKGKSLKIKITPPPWLTLWAYIFYFIVLTCLIAAILQYRVKKQREKMRQYMNEIEYRNLKKLEEEKSNFYINLAHETKTPLTLIKNYLERDIEKRGVSENIKIVYDNIKKLSRDMVNFLDIEKLEKGLDFYNHDQIIEVVSMLEKKIRMFKEAASQKNINLTSQPDWNSGLAPVYLKIDPSGIDRIFNNLLENAIRYTDPGGQIKVATLADEKHFILSISDTGVGIAQEKLQYIFSPYYQISHEKRNVQGIGIGLAIVKKIVDSINGNIKVESELGRGSTFILSLPRYFLKENEISLDHYGISRPQEYGSMVKLKPEFAGKNDHTILLVEDNKEIIYLLQDHLSQKYNFYYACSGEDGLEKLKSIPKPDIIILDIMLDGIDGCEVFSRISKSNYYTDIPVIFLTAKALPELKKEQIRKGAVDYIQKPFDMYEVSAKIDSLISLRDKTRESRRKELIQRLLEDEHPSKEGAEIRIDRQADRFSTTPRENEIISHIIKGKLNKEIAGELGISEGTVERHLFNIYKKCNIQNRTELTRLFLS